MGAQCECGQRTAHIIVIAALTAMIHFKSGKHQCFCTGLSVIWFSGYCRIGQPLPLSTADAKMRNAHACEMIIETEESLWMSGWVAVAIVTGQTPSAKVAWQRRVWTTG
ncbi:hypothetical protein CEXT_163931 [Caerostris extrusa]|uniref:Uncharacterized protein n=1 Tax=Caerostris extrusa TaxID=172846 RepID=A0AAV4T310_CAEEX|nr:hypothetical protein CEXT_163931 [Caerostris extrusa]